MAPSKSEEREWSHHRRDVFLVGGGGGRYSSASLTSAAADAPHQFDYALLSSGGGGVGGSFSADDTFGADAHLPTTAEAEKLFDVSMSHFNESKISFGSNNAAATAAGEGGPMYETLTRYSSGHPTSAAVRIQPPPYPPPPLPPKPRWEQDGHLVMPSMDSRSSLMSNSSSRPSGIYLGSDEHLLNEHGDAERGYNVSFV